MIEISTEDADKVCALVRKIMKSEADRLDLVADLVRKELGE